MSCVLTILPVCGLSVNSPRVSPVFPSYTKILKSEPTLAKWSPEGEKRTSCTNFVCVLMVYNGAMSIYKGISAERDQGRTLSYLNGTPEACYSLRPHPNRRCIDVPWWKTIEPSSATVAARNGRCALILTALIAWQILLAGIVQTYI